MTSLKTLTVLTEIDTERENQDEKWGQQNHHPQMWLNILMEEVGETSRAMMDAHFRKDDWDDYRKEMVQVAAVAVAAIESFDRKAVE